MPQMLLPGMPEGAIRINPAWRDLDKQVARRATPRKVTVNELPEDQRPSQLLPLAKTLTDTVKMIA